jgi:hypothetical protein
MKSTMVVVWMQAEVTEGNKVDASSAVMDWEQEESEGTP